MKKKCVKCGFPKYNNTLGIIWLSKDGYCSVCNNHFKDRKKEIGGMDNFVKTTLIKEGTYNHLNSEGGKMTNKRKLLEEVRSKNKMMNHPAALRKAREKGIKRIEEFL